jgi:hypothetical protein
LLSINYQLTHLLFSHFYQEPSWATLYIFLIVPVCPEHGLPIAGRLRCFLIILDIEYFPLVNSLLSNPELGKPAKACMALPSFFVMCLVVGRVYQFVSVDAPWHKSTTYIVTCVLRLIG